MAKFWLSMLTELRNRGPRGILICCCDGLSGLPEAIMTGLPFPSLETQKYVCWRCHNPLIGLAGQSNITGIW